MDFTLSPEEARVLGCLIEKAVTTPEVYPLTLNSLVAACNQRSNRNPVVDYDEGTVNAALDSLRATGLVRRVDTAGSRTAKFRHVLPAVLPLDAPQLALLCVLLLRGPQTSGELRARSDRLHPFRDLAEVEATLSAMAQPAPDDILEEPVVAPLPLRPGSRELRHVHLLSGVPVDNAEAAAPGADVEFTAPEPRATRAELDALRGEVEALRTQLQALRADFDALRSQLE